MSRELFERAQARRAGDQKENFRRRGKDSPFLLTSLLVCSRCGFRLQGYGHCNGGEEIARVRVELAAFQAEADRLPDITTPANRDFVDERLGKVRTQRQALESRLADLKRVDCRPVDLEAATADALAYLGRFREVLEIGTLEQRKESLTRAHRMSD